MPPGGVLWIKATRVHQDGDPDEILAEIQFTRVLNAFSMTFHSAFSFFTALDFLELKTFLPKFL